MLIRLLKDYLVSEGIHFDPRVVFVYIVVHGDVLIVVLEAHAMGPNLRDQLTNKRRSIETSIGGCSSQSTGWKANS